MPDSYILTGPGGSQLNLATWTIYADGIDTGAREIRVPGIAENALAEGGAFGYERNPARRWTIPLRLASTGTYGGLDGLAAHIQNQARPGALLTIIPDGYASDSRVCFDVLHGELGMRPYSPRMQTAHRREYDLQLVTEPFGWAPTWMIVASAASVGMPGQLALAASMTGDAPGLAVVTITPTQAGPPTAPGTWMVDSVAWSAGLGPSFAALLGGGSWLSAIPSGAYNARSESITGTVLTLYTSPTQTGWTTLAYWTIPSALEPAYRGVHRAYGYLRRHTDIAPLGTVTAWKLALDVAPGIAPSAAFASTAQKAAFPAGPASAIVHSLVDLGQVSLPAVASGVQSEQRLRLWGWGPGNVATDNNFTELAGIVLMPVSPGGALRTGMVVPDFLVGSAGLVKFDAARRTVEIGLAGAGASAAPLGQGIGNYRGGFPLLGPSQAAVAITGAARRGAHATAYLYEVVRDQPLVYYPFADTPSTATLADLSGNGRHGTYIRGGSYGIAGRPGDPGELAHRFDGASAAAHVASTTALNILNPIGTGITTYELWFRRLSLTPSYDQILFGHGTQITTGTFVAFGIGFPGPSLSQYGRGQLVHWGYPSAAAGPYGVQIASNGAIADYDWHHLVIRQRRNTTANMVTVFLDASKINDQITAHNATYSGTGLFVIGRQPAVATKFFDGEIADFAIYGGSLSDERISAHYNAGVGKDTTFVRPAAQHAAVSVLYRPRFTFARSL